MVVSSYQRSSYRSSRSASRGHQGSYAHSTPSKRKRPPSYDSATAHTRSSSLTRSSSRSLTSYNASSSLADAYYGKHRRYSSSVEREGRPRSAEYGGRIAYAQARTLKRQEVSPVRPSRYSDSLDTSYNREYVSKPGYEYEYIESHTGSRPYRHRSSSLTRDYGHELSTSSSSSLSRQYSASSLTTKHGNDYHMSKSLQSSTLDGVKIYDGTGQRKIYSLDSCDPTEVETLTLPSGKLAKTYTRKREHGSAENPQQALQTIDQIIQRTQFLENWLYTLEDFVRKNRSLFPEETVVHQQIRYYLLSDEELKKIGEKPGAEVYGVKLSEKLVVPLGTDVNTLLRNYKGNSEVSVEHSGPRRRFETDTEEEDSWEIQMRRSKRRREEEETDSFCRRLRSTIESYDLSSSTPLSSYDDSSWLPSRRPRYNHPHSVDTGFSYDDLSYRPQHYGSLSSLSDHDSARWSGSSRRPMAGARQESLPHFTAKLRSKRCSEGDTVRFNCSVSGLPVPDVTWYRGSHPVLPGGRYRIANNYGLLSLEIDHVGKEDAGLYTVRVSSPEGGEVSCSASLDIEDGAFDSSPYGTTSGIRKPYFIHELQSVWAEVGSKVSMEAHAAGQPAPTFIWQRDNINLNEDDRVRMFSDDLGNAKLIIRDVRPTDNGLYFCMAENKGGRVKCAASLRVVEKGGIVDGSGRRRSTSREPTPTRHFDDLYMPLDRRADVPLKGTKPWFIQVPPPQITIHEGDPLSIICAIDGDPKPMVSWLKGVRELQYSKRHRVMVDYNRYILEINSTLNTDGGQYVVMAQNPLGRISASVWVNMLPPRYEADEDMVITRMKVGMPEYGYEIVNKGTIGNMAPRFIKRLPLESSVDEGEDLSMLCKVSDSHRPYMSMPVSLRSTVKKEAKLITEKITIGKHGEVKNIQTTEEVFGPRKKEAKKKKVPTATLR